MRIPQDPIKRLRHQSASLPGIVHSPPLPCVAQGLPPCDLHRSPRLTFPSRSSGTRGRVLHPGPCRRSLASHARRTASIAGHSPAGAFSPRRARCQPTNHPPAEGMEGAVVGRAWSIQQSRQQHAGAGRVGRARYSMTWSARSSNDCGIVRPSPLAVLRLITTSVRSVQRRRPQQIQFGIHGREVGHATFNSHGSPGW